MRIFLGGHLNFYHPEKKTWMDLQIEGPSQLSELLVFVGVPLEEVQLVVVNGEMVDGLEVVVCEGDEVKVFSAVGGG